METRKRGTGKPFTAGYDARRRTAKQTISEGELLAEAREKSLRRLCKLINAKDNTLALEAIRTLADFIRATGGEADFPLPDKAPATIEEGDNYVLVS